MEKVRIRSTDLVVNPIGLGTNAVGGQKYYPHITDEDGRMVLRTALSVGIDFWDTAYTYGPKRSEEIIGEILKESGKRHEIILASKAAHDDSSGETIFNNSPNFLKQSVEEALKRLKTDYIDLFYIHFPDESTPKYESIGALKLLKDEGKIRAIGVSNFSLEQLKEANKDGYVNVYQGKYNLIDRSNEETIMKYTLENNISFVPYFPLASGLLTGKYNENSTFPKGDLRLESPDFQGERYKHILAKVAQLRMLAEKKGVTVAQLVLATYLAHEAIDVIIPGAKQPNQIKDNLNTLRVQLSAEDLNKIHALFKDL